MQRPNVLILYTDQQRWDALRYNGNPEIHTPNLDRLAESGANFSHCFVQNPVCMPSRISFMSGQYPSTLGITHMGVPVPQSVLTLPGLLRTYGYYSANIGKLHFLPHANRDHRVPHPDYGFDHLEISDEPGVYEDAYRAWVARTAPDQLPYLSVGLPPATDVWYSTMGIDDSVAHPAEGGRFDFKGAVPFPGAEDVTHSAFVAQQTIEFLRSRRGDRPFLCIAGFYSPHAPWVVPQRYLELYDPAALTLPDLPPEMDCQRSSQHFADEQLRSARHGYYAMVSEVDHYVGQILDQLDESGLTENTIVVFTSDHGEWLGEHLRFGKSYPGHDPVSRVPLIIAVPELGKGPDCDAIVEAVDVVPTLLELSGIQRPLHLQGQSLLPLLCDGYRGDGEREEKQAALMEGNGWKALRTRNFRYVVNADGREHLYDLRQRWGEYSSVADDAAYGQELYGHRHLLVQRLLQMERPLPRVWPY